MIDSVHLRRRVAEYTPGARRSITTVAPLVWIAAAAGVGVHAFLYPRTHTVFPIYAKAARTWWRGLPLYPQLEWDEFRYSPAFAVFLSPLAYVPERWGGMAWKVLNGVAYAAALTLWTRHQSADAARRDDMSLVLLLALGGAAASLYDGNANLMAVAAIMLALVATGRDRWIRGGVLLAAATLIKAFPAALAAMLAAMCGSPIAVAFTATLLAGLALPIAIAPHHTGVAQTVAWLTLLVARSGERQVRYASIDQVFRLYAHPLPLAWSNAMAAVAGLVVVIMCRVHARRVDRRNALTFTFAMFSAWVILFLPTTEPATVAFIAPSLSWMLVDACRRREPGWTVTLAVSWWLTGPAMTDVAGSSARVFAQAYGALSIGSLLFASYLVAHRYSMKMRETA